MNFKEFEKSDSTAIALRNEGNKLYGQRKFFDALLKYNESLCYAVGNEILALTYGNRSAVYFQMKMYSQCLNNIHQARINKYPANKLPTLIDREKRCLELMKQQQHEAPEDPFTFFKLSYPANEKVPFIIKGVKLESDTKYGRKIIADQPLKIGDIVSIESPFFYALLSDPRYGDGKPSNKFNFCHYCLNENKLDLLPCLNCTSTMYCSETCQAKAHQYHQYEDVMFSQLQNLGPLYPVVRSFFRALSIMDGSIEALEVLFEECLKTPTTIFDYNFYDPENRDYIKNQLKVALSLARDPAIKIDLHVISSLFSRLNESLMSHHDFIYKFLLHLYQVEQHTSSEIAQTSQTFGKRVIIGRGNFLFGALINHSCSPNVMRLPVNDKMCLMVIRPIEKDEQLFDVYLKVFCDMETEERQKQLKEYNFDCDCEACNQPEIYTNFSELKVFDEDLFRYVAPELGTNYKLMTRDEIIKNAQKIKHKMEEIYKLGHYPSKEFRILQVNFLSCMEVLATQK